MFARIPFIAFFLFALTLSTIGAEPEFDREIAPLLSRRCLSCHAGDDAEGKLDLTSHATTIKGGENGSALTPGDLKKSLLWRRVAAGEMPEDKPLPDNERELLKKWIEAGAKWGTDPIDPFLMSSDSRAGYDWWSLQTLNSSLPDVVDKSWPKNAIDYFVLAKLEAANLKPSKQAETSRLVRRIYFATTGLPPEADRLQNFQNEIEAGDWHNLVDQLLASHQFGQRWARNWLDVARYGESHGFEYNQPRNNSWWYRNWVIESLNADLPYDEFVRLQIAGDAIRPNDGSAWAATGFLVAGPHNTTKPSSQKMRKTMRHDELEDMVGTVGQTFLGLTINCARCHDHKFDPITQKEYYQLVATLVGIDHGEREHPATHRRNQQLNQIQEQLKSAQERLKKLNLEKETGCDDKADDEIKSLSHTIKGLEQRAEQLKKQPNQKIYMAKSGKTRSVSRLRRGDVSSPAEAVVPGGLRAINAQLADFQLDEKASDAERRTKLANWITKNQNPLLARVIVNRIWQHYFGQGLVRTPSDFGFNGDRPSHPKLLDYLAQELIRNDWQLKPIHRMILTSSTFQQDSRFRDDAAKQDANNRLLWRMAPRRLTAEELRDSILLVSGQLDDRHGGSGYRDVREYKFKGSHYYDPIDPQGPNAVRRTVYRFSPRGAKRTILETFDCPDPSAKAPKREVTTTPLQALSLLNNQFVLTSADRFANMSLRSETDQATRIQDLYRRVYFRDADKEELNQALQFADEHGFHSLCRVAFNSNEFLYVR